MEQKEKLPISSERVRVPDEIPTVEKPREENLEVDSWLTKIEKRFARIPQGKPGSADDQVIIQQPQSKQPPIKLPVTAAQVVQHAKAKPELSIAWLVQWAVRQFRMLSRLGRRVEYSDIPEVEKESNK